MNGILLLCIIICLQISVHSCLRFQNPLCYIFECCNDDYIITDIEGLSEELNQKVYGQQIAKETIVSALRSHINNWKTSSKPLTLSFHGWPGSGKNYITSFIVKHLYKFGSGSKYVSNFIGRYNFPNEEKISEYQDYLYKLIREKISNCPRQLFIFDEVDKMPKQLLDIIKPLLDYRDSVDRLDFRQAIFIFLSNSGSELINEQYFEYWKNGRSRKSLNLKDFENLITKGAFNEEGGFQYSDTIKSNLIDHYIPFLPLEYTHVKLCILDQFEQRGINNPSEEDIKEAMEFVEWGPDPEKPFSKTGCKRISQKVGLITAKKSYIRYNEL